MASSEDVVSKRSKNKNSLELDTPHQNGTCVVIGGVFLFEISVILPNGTS